MKYLNFSLIALFSLFLATACVVTSEKPIFTSSTTVEMPDISGAFSNAKQETYLLTKSSDSTNTFTLTAPDKSTMTLIFEPLKTKGRYVAQVANPAGPQVMFMLISLETPGEISIYAINPTEATELAKKHNVTLGEAGSITNEPSMDDLRAYFEASFTEPYSAKAETIGVGSKAPASK